MLVSNSTCYTESQTWEMTINIPCYIIYLSMTVYNLFSPLGPLTSFISTILSVTLLLRRIHSLTRPPASFSASTAPLWVTSLTSVSFTRTIQSFTLHSNVTQRMLKYDNYDNRMSKMSSWKKATRNWLTSYLYDLLSNRIWVQGRFELCLFYSQYVYILDPPILSVVLTVLINCWWYLFHFSQPE